MGRLFVFMGKSASGKDTLYQKIKERESHLKSVIPYTTRPIRSGETEGKEYHFVSFEQMKQWERENKIVECRCYHTVRGDWYYFTAEDGQIDFSESSYMMISTLEGYEKLREFYGADNVVPIYIEVEDFLRLERSLKRERQQKQPCVAEVCRRFLADEEDFSEEKLQKAGIGTRIKNHVLEEAIHQIEAVLENKKW